MEREGTGRKDLFLMLSNWFPGSVCFKRSIVLLLKEHAPLVSPSVFICLKS